jgi:hypothetical protein
MMITIQSNVHVNGIGGLAIYDFLINPTDRSYQQWWPGTHLEFHRLKQTPNHVGDVIYMNEFVGRHHLKMGGIVLEAEPGKKIIWQLKKFIPLPIWLSVRLEDNRDGVAVIHTLTIGFKGIGRLLDALVRLYVTDEFEKAMDEHAHIEFPKLRELLLAGGQS